METTTFKHSMIRIIRQTLLILGLTLFFYLLLTKLSYGADFLLPKLEIGLEKGEGPADASLLLQIVFLLTILTLAPAIVILMTSFTRLAVVFSFLRHALGTQQTPSNQIIAGLALFLTFFIMMPVWQKIHNNALRPYLNEEISQEVALKEAMTPVRQFMFKQTREKDLSLFVSMAEMDKPKNMEDIPTSVLIPAFVIS